MANLLTAGIALALAWMGAFTPAVSPPPTRPVMVGGDANYDACSSSGQPKGLKPGGDNFLTVRAAPITTAKSLFRLKPGHIFHMCDDAMGWTGIVFDPRAPGADGLDCGVGTPIVKRAPYKGPCMSGWVSSSYVMVVAG